MQSQSIDSLIPPLLDNGPSVLQPTLGYLQSIHQFLSLQASEGDLFVNVIESLGNCLDVMRGVLLVRDAGDAQQRVVAGEADDAQFLLGVHLAEDLIEA